MHKDPNVSADELKPFVAQVTGVAEDDIEVGNSKIRLTIPKERLEDLEKLDSINRIEEVRPKVAFNNLSREVLQADAFINTTQFAVEEEVVCVGDTGFDLGLSKDQSGLHVSPVM